MWVSPSKASKTEVEAIGFTSKEHYPSSVRAILKIISFLKWMGFQPVVVTSLSSGYLHIGFAGLHVTTVLFVLTIALQITLTINYLTYQIANHTKNALADVLFVGSMICSTTFIPRIGLANKAALESALNTIKEIQGSLCSNFTSFKLWQLTILVLFLEFLPIIFNTILIHFISDEAQALRNPIFTLGTGIPLIGTIMFKFVGAFSAISTWMLPIQLFMFCHTLARYYQDFADKIRHDLYPDHSCSSQVGISEKFPTHDVGHSQKFRNRLKKLQATSVLLEKAVSDVNAYIGMALMLYLLCQLLHILGSLYYVSNLALKIPFLNTGESIRFTENTLTLVQQSAELLFVIWAADLIPTAVNKCKEVVGGIPFCDGDFKDEHASLDIQLQSFRSHITTKNVEISAYGLLTISRNMIPSVFGTIITYYLIVSQYTQNQSCELALVNAKNFSV